MRRTEGMDRPARVREEEPGRREDAVAFRLVRHSHIFAAAVREVLETSLLREVTSLPLTLAQFHVLKLMANNGEHEVGQVADFLGVSAPAATKNIDKLERFGLVTRSPSPSDRRATLLSISAKTRRLVRRYEEMKRARLAPVLTEFTPAEVERLSGLLERFAVSLLKRGDSGNGCCLRCAAYIEEGCPVGRLRGGCPYTTSRDARPRQDSARRNA